ncbi:MAG: alpha-L-arabinofuranosidase [Chitinophagaceae bacterium]|nr:MAG: alpha-L-arabinofuranosidase [Chitinophagaceae bacterium]
MKVAKVIILFWFEIIGITLFSCKKSQPVKLPEVPNPPDTSVSVPVDTNYNPVNAPVAATMGFFLNNWQPKSYTPPANVKDTTAFSGAADVNITVDMNHVITKVSPEVFGNNANLWIGQLVTQPVLMKYITDLSPNIIRGPGGSISDVYFWNQSSAPPSDVPDSLYISGKKTSAGYWYGGNTQSWTLALNNYYALLQQTNSTGILTINYGYARYGTGPHPVQTAAHLAADWVRYDQGRTKYWEIGNEDGGSWEAGYQIDPFQNQDGQPAIITGNLYGQQFLVFADSMRVAAKEAGATIYIGAQLLDAPPPSWADQTNKTWNQEVLTTAGSNADFFIVHDYFTPYQTNSGVQDVLATGNTVPADAMNYLNQQFSQYGVASKPVALTEWNIQATGSMQDVSYIAGVHAAITLGELIKNKFGEASRWDLANGWSNGNDMGMFNIGDEPGGAPLWNPRPAFYYMYYFQKCFGDRMVSSSVGESNDILCYASSFGTDGAGIIIINKSANTHQVGITLQHYATGSNYCWYTLTGGSDNGNFSRKVYVNGQGPAGVSGGPLNYATVAAYSASTKSGIKITVPPYGVVYLVVARN